MKALYETRIVQQQKYQDQAFRLEKKLGSGNPRALEYGYAIKQGPQVIRSFALTADAAGFQTPVATERTAAMSGRVSNPKSQPVMNCTITLVRANGSIVATAGRTDASGFYSCAFDEAQTASLSKAGGVYLKVTDPDGREVYRSEKAFVVNANSHYQEAITIPLYGVPREIPLPPSVEEETPGGPSGGGGGGVAGALPPDAWVVWGRVVYDDETPGAGLIISLYDKDLIFDDKLGTTETDDNGDFRIIYRTEAFRDLFEHNPDLYLDVLDRTGKKLFTSRGALRFQAGREEEFRITIKRSAGGKKQ
jgi:hypothetical protein